MAVTMANEKTTRIREAIGGGQQATQVPCNQCGTPTETIYEKTLSKLGTGPLCPGCYTEHYERLHSKTQESSRFCQQLYKARLAKPRDSQAADDEFRRAVESAGGDWSLYDAALKEWNRKEDARDSKSGKRVAR